MIGKKASDYTPAPSGTGGGLSWLSEGEAAVLSFLTEPEEHIVYAKAYDEATGSYRYFEDDDPNKPENASTKYLAAVFVHDSDSEYDFERAVAFELPLSARREVVRLAGKYGSAMGRQWEIDRTGSGKQTRYEVTPLDPCPTPEVEEIPDLIAALNAQASADGATSEGGTSTSAAARRPVGAF